MKFLDEFRDSRIAQSLIHQIRQRVSQPWVLMEVCGGQTHSLLRHGIDQELAGVVELIHGPGCPVCVTPVEAIELAIRLSQRPDTIVASFGDMLRVPGRKESLNDARTKGGRVQVVYSPLDAVELSSRHPENQVIFFAVGFETTLPATALAVLQAEKRGLENFSLLSAHVRVLPAMRAIVSAPGNRVQGFLAAGHVCTVTGFEEYEEFVQQYRLPVVVTGFEPVDLLQGILESVTQLETGVSEVSNRYGRSVRQEGNRQAQEIIDRVYQAADVPWRGMGVIPGGGFVLRDEYAQFDAQRRFPVHFELLPILAEQPCHSGEVLTGVIKPHECPSFGTACTPLTPLGAPMVSSEGACAAYYRYHGAVTLEAMSCPVSVDKL